jgi:hypothetical protein
MLAASSALSSNILFGYPAAGEGCAWTLSRLVATLMLRLSWAELAAVMLWCF